MKAIKQVQDTIKKQFGTLSTRMEGTILEVIDSYYYGGEEKLAYMVSEWSAGGMYHSYFKDSLGIDLQVEDSFYEITATGRYKRYSDAGVLVISLRINN